MEQDRKDTFRDCLHVCFPTIGNYYENLLEYSSLRFVGPFVLFSFLNDVALCKQFPLHIQCDQNDIFEVISFFKEIGREVVGQKNTHLLETKQNEATLCVEIDKNHVFLFLSNDTEETQATIDVFTVWYDIHRGYLAPTKLSKNLAQKHYDIDVAVFKKQFQSIEAIKTFFKRDCVALFEIGFLVDWNIQHLWKFIWKRIIRDTAFMSLSKFLIDWNKEAFETFKTSQKKNVAFPMLYLCVCLPFLNVKDFTVQNSMYGTCVFDVDFVKNAERNENNIRYAISWYEATTLQSRQRSANLVQLGFFFTQQNKDLNFINDENEKRILLFDLYEESTIEQKPVELQKETMPSNCFVLLTQDIHENIEKDLEKNANHVVVFFQTKSNNYPDALCFDKEIALNFATEKYFCWHTESRQVKVKTSPKYWSLPMQFTNDGTPTNIIITDENLNMLINTTERYFYLLKLKRDPIPTAEDIFESECNEEELATIHVFFPVHLVLDKDKTMSHAIAKMMSRLYKNIDRRTYSIVADISLGKKLQPLTKNIQPIVQKSQQKERLPQLLKSPTRLLSQQRKTISRETPVKTQHMQFPFVFHTPHQRFVLSDDDTTEADSEEEEKQIRREQRADFYE